MDIVLCFLVKLPATERRHEKWSDGQSVSDWKRS